MQHDYFISLLTEQAMYFEIVLFLFIIGILLYGCKNYRFFLWRFFALLFGIFSFESLTGALWINSNLGQHAYIHNDISWVMTLTWGGLIMFCKFTYDYYLKHKNIENSIGKEFFTITLGASILGLGILTLLKEIGIFSYSPEVQKIVESGITIFGKPLEALIYFPVFIFASYSFYKYWELAMYNKKIFDNYKISFGKDICISVINIVLIGYILHPIFIISNIYTYIIIILLFMLNLIITSFIISKLIDITLFIRFIAGTFIFTVLGSIIVSMFVGLGTLQFSQSSLNTYTDKTIQMPFLHITDVEFAGILLFSYFMIAMIKYFKIITDYRSVELDDKNMTFRGWNSLFIHKD